MAPTELIFISGWATWGDVWDAVAKDLDMPYEFVCWSDPAALDRALDQAKAPPIVIGWSMGALMALDAARRRPERIRALALVSGMARMTASKGYPGASPRALRSMRLKIASSPSETLMDFFKACFAPDENEERIKNLADLAQGFGSLALEAGLDYLAETDLRSFVPEIKIPTYVAHGTLDAIVPVACGEWLADNLPNAKFARLDGIGHASPLLAPAQLTEGIRELIDASAA